MLFKLKNAALQVAVMWGTKESDSSNETPMFLINEEHSTAWPETDSTSSGGLGR
jgi:hypothetical protein